MIDKKKIHIILNSIQSLCSEYKQLSQLRTFLFIKFFSMGLLIIFITFAIQ